MGRGSSDIPLLWHRAESRQAVLSLWRDDRRGIRPRQNRRTVSVIAVGDRRGLSWRQRAAENARGKGRWSASTVARRGRDFSAIRSCPVLAKNQPRIFPLL